MNVKSGSGLNALARQLGVSRQLLSQHKRKADSPPLSDAAAWRKYLDSHGRIETAAPSVRAKIDQKKLEKLTHETEQASLDIAERKKTVVEVARVLAALAKNVARARAMLDAGLITDFCARMGGRPSDELALEMAKVLKDIYAELSKPLV